MGFSIFPILLIPQIGIYIGFAVAFKGLYANFMNKEVSYKFYNKVVRSNFEFLNLYN
jgi:hypothetical protein